MPYQARPKSTKTNAERQAAFQARQRSLTPLRRLVLTYCKTPAPDCLFRYTAAEQARASEIQSLIATAQGLADHLQDDILARVAQHTLNPRQQEVRDQFRSKVIRYTFAAY